MLAWLRRFKKSQSGLTLIEVMVSAILLTMTSVTVIGILTSGYLVLQRQVNFDRGTKLARHKIEEVENQAVEDIYPADAAGDFLFTGAGPGPSPEPDGVNDGKLTSDYGSEPPILGSETVAYCPVCGKLHHPYKLTGGPLPKTCKNYDQNDNGITFDKACMGTGDSGAQGEKKLCGSDADCNAGDKCVDDDLHCANDNATGNALIDGEDNSCAGTGVPLPAPGQSGFYTVTVKVHAYEEGTTDPLPSYALCYDASPATDPGCRASPLKGVKVKVEWYAMSEYQKFEVETLLSRLIPKYAFQEQKL